MTFYFKLKRIFYCSWKHKEYICFYGPHCIKCYPCDKELKDFLEKLKKDKK